MPTAHFHSLKKIAAGTAFAVAVAAVLFFQNDESVAKHIGARQAATYQNANLGEALPGLLGSGFAPNLW
jgi:hypothetical protein